MFDQSSKPIRTCCSLDCAEKHSVAPFGIGGPNYREAQLCMEMIADTCCLASLDLVEYNPMLDVRGQTAELLLDLLQSLFGKSTLSRPHSPATALS